MTNTNTPTEKNAKIPSEAPATAAKLARRVAPKKSTSKKAAPKGKRPHTARPGANKAKPAAKAAREGSKKAKVLELLHRKQGATLEAIMKAMDWQAHTVRGFVSGTRIKKLGLKVESFRSEDGERTYRING